MICSSYCVGVLRSAPDVISPRYSHTSELHNILSTNLTSLSLSRCFLLEKQLIVQARPKSCSWKDELVKILSINQ